MTLAHIVLVRLKPEVKADDVQFAALRKECDALFQKSDLAPLVKEGVWRKPEYTTRNQGYDWGLYSLFEDKATYEQYRDHPTHRTFVSDVLLKYVDGELLAYDFEL